MTGTTPTSIAIPPATKAEVQAPTPAKKIEREQPEASSAGVTLNGPASASADKKSSKTEDEAVDENATPLPEGFFDDPILDAKVTEVHQLYTFSTKWLIELFVEPESSLHN